MSWLILRLAAASTLTALSCSSALGAEETKPLVAQAQNAMATCSEYWTAKSADEVASLDTKNNGAAAAQKTALETNLAALEPRVEAAKADVARLKAAFDSSLEQTVEDAAKTGLAVTWETAPSVAKAAGTNAMNDADAEALRRAEAELARLLHDQSRDKVALTGLPAFAAMVGECSKDQLAYIDPALATTATVSAPPAVAIPAEVKGVWRANCEEAKGTTWLLDGWFSFAINADDDGTRRLITGNLNFDAGGGYLTGYLYKDGGFAASTGSFNGTNTVYFMSGQVVPGASGGFKLAGIASAQMGADTLCKGTFETTP